MKVLSYYAVVGDDRGRGFIEVLVRRENGRQISQEPTGVTYKTARAAQAALAEKNARVAVA